MLTKINIRQIWIALFLFLYSCQNNNTTTVDSIVAFSEPSAIDYRMSSNISIEDNRLFLLPKVVSAPNEFSKTENAYEEASAYVYDGGIDTARNLIIEADLTLIKEVCLPLTTQGINVEIESENKAEMEKPQSEIAEFDFAFLLESENITVTEYCQGIDSSNRKFGENLKKYLNNDVNQVELTIIKKNKRLSFFMNGNLVVAFVPKYWFNHMFIQIQSENYKVLIERFNLDYEDGVNGNRSYDTSVNKLFTGDTSFVRSPINDGSMSTNNSDTFQNVKRDGHSQVSQDTSSKNDKPEVENSISNRNLLPNWNTVNVALAILASCLTIITAIISFKRK